MYWIMNVESYLPSLSVWAPVALGSAVLSAPLG